MGSKLTFEKLVGTIQKVHEHFTAQASKAVNISLTLRNWVVGFYIYEYEQNGSDRASYGEHLLDNLSDRLANIGMKRVDSRELRRYRQFYLIYPRIREALTPEFNPTAIVRTLSAQFNNPSRTGAHCHE